VLLAVAHGGLAALDVEIRDYDRGAFAGELNRRRAPDSARRTRDHCHLAFQPVHFRFPSRLLSRAARFGTCPFESNYQSASRCCQSRTEFIPSPSALLGRCISRDKGGATIIRCRVVPCRGGRGTAYGSSSFSRVLAGEESRSLSLQSPSARRRRR